LATASGKVEGVKGPGKLATPFERTKVAAYTLAAITPCMRLYSFLGKELQALLDPEDDRHPYKKWIDSYSSESFQVIYSFASGILHCVFNGPPNYILLTAV
jgi:thiaminase